MPTGTVTETYYVGGVAQNTRPDSGVYDLRLDWTCSSGGSVSWTTSKAVVGIGVVNNSQRNSFAASAIRNLLRMVDGFGFYLVGTLVASCSKFRRRIGDFCAGTYVVEGNVSQLTRCLAVLGWLALLSAGAWALPHVCAQPRPLQAPRHLGQMVIGIGRADNSIYMKLPNHRIDLSMVSAGPAEHSPTTADQAASTGSKLGDPDATPAVP